MTKFLSTILLVTFASAVTASAAPISSTDITERESRIEAAPTTATPSGLPIINDDFERARTEANKRKLPLFVEVWAPW